MARTNKTNFPILRLIFIAAASAAFLAVCSLSTTPLLRFQPGQDSAFFRLVGLGMTKGLLPYRDFFDMKGPYLFWLQYLGQLLAPGRLGAFLVQWACMAVSLNWVFKCLDLAKGKLPIWASMVLLAPMGYVMSYTMTGGNLTEELSMPFLMPCLYLFLRWLGNARENLPEKQDHSPWAGFYYGVAFGMMALIRITNAALIGAVLLTVTADLLVWKRFRNLLRNAGMFLAGVLAGVLPGLIWCWTKGILGDMLTQVFAFGFLYSGEGGVLDSLKAMGTVRLCLLLPMLPAVPLALFKERDWRCWLFFAAGAATTVVAALMGNGYCHYFVLAIPNMVYAAFVGLSKGKKGMSRNGLRCAVSAVLVLVVLAAQWPLFRPRALEEIRYAMYCARYDVEERGDHDAVQALKARIPEGESLYFYGFPSCSALYIQAELLPPNKYCDWQPHYIQLNPEIGREIEAFLTSEGSRWVATPKGQVSPRSVEGILLEGYEPVMEADNFRLWMKKDAV